MRQQLAQSEEVFRLLVQAVQDYAIYLMAPDGTILSWNTGAEKIKGYRQEEILGRSFSCFFPPEDRAADVPRRILNAAARRGSFTAEGWRLRKDRTRFWAHVTVTALLDEEGRLRGFAKVTRDVTERRKHEAQLQEVNAALEERVKQRTEELQALNEDLEAFTAAASHDLRAPLRQLIGFSEMLEYSLGDDLSPEARSFLGRIHQTGGRMNRIIDDLLTFSRLGRQELRKVRTDLRLLCQQVISEMHPEIDPARVVVTVRELATFDADPSLLRHVFHNLIGNAVKYSRSRDKARVDVGVLPQPSGEPAIYVRDNGVGFPDGKADLLFHPFQRLHSEQEFEGTGIGLATVQRIISRHGGRVWAENIPAGGAAFYFTLSES